MNVWILLMMIWWAPGNAPKDATPDTNMFIEAVKYSTEQECLDAKEEKKKEYSDRKKWLRADVECFEVERGNNGSGTK